MSECKFTPGPWVWDIGTFERFLVLDADDRLIAWVTYRDEDDDDIEPRTTQEANTVLIATAPDMYAVLAATAGFLLFVAEDHEIGVSKEAEQLYESAMRTLKKARGEA